MTGLRANAPRCLVVVGLIALCGCASSTGDTKRDHSDVVQRWSIESARQTRSDLFQDVGSVVLTSDTIILDDTLQGRKSYAVTRHGSKLLISVSDVVMTFYEVHTKLLDNDTLSALVVLQNSGDYKSLYTPAPKIEEVNP